LSLIKLGNYGVIGRYYYIARYIIKIRLWISGASRKKG
jgi:hypothetical protein